MNAIAIASTMDDHGATTAMHGGGPVLGEAEFHYLRSFVREHCGISLGDHKRQLVQGRLLRRLRMPYVRRAAPEVIATAASQRWEPAEVLRVLLAEEAAGRDQATIAMRRRASGLPAGKTFDAWDPDASPIPKATQHALRTLEWIHRAESTQDGVITLESIGCTLPLSELYEDLDIPDELPLPSPSDD